MLKAAAAVPGMVGPEEKVVVVLGLGNLLAHDEGFGIHALRELQLRLNREVAVELEGNLPASASGDSQDGNGDETPDADMGGVQFVDGGVLGLGLLPLVETCTHLLVLDAVDTHSPPGTVVELDGEQLPLYATQKLSEHQVGFQEILALARFRGNFPRRLKVIGVEPEDLSGGIGLSARVSKAMGEVVERGKRLLEEWEEKD